MKEPRIERLVKYIESVQVILERSSEYAGLFSATDTSIPGRPPSIRVNIDAYLNRKYLLDTIRHEFAHAIDVGEHEDNFSYCFSLCKTGGHGENWERIVTALRGKPEKTMRLSLRQWKRLPKALTRDLFVRKCGCRTYFSCSPENRKLYATNPCGECHKNFEFLPLE